MTYRLLMLPPQDEVTRSWAEVVGDQVPAARVEVAESEEQALLAIVEADAAYGTLTRDLLQAATRLRWLQAPAAAPPAGYFFDDLVSHPVTVTNFRGIYNDHVATHAVAMVLALSRGFQRYLPRQAQGEWSPNRTEEAVLHLPEAEVLIVGLGGIGKEISRLLSVHGCRITATDAREETAPDWVEDLETPDGLERLLPTADHVVLTVPHTPETEGLMNRERFEAMKSSAFLVNIGRGKTVVLDDLVDALDTGRIAGAGLDVFEVEPLPSSHPLWTMPNVILTPHVAVAGPYIEERRFNVFLENARRFAQGEPLMNVVDKAAWF